MCCGMDQHLTSDREADGADLGRVDVRPRTEIRSSGVQVPLPSPAEGVRVALALPFAAAVEQENSIAVARKHARLLLGARAAGESNYGGAVLRRDVPTLEEEPVAGPELDLLESAPELGPRNLGPRGVGDDIGDRCRQEDGSRGKHHARSDQESASVPPRPATALPPRPPEGRRADTKQEEPGDERQEPGVVVTGGPTVRGVVGSFRGREYAEIAEEKRERGAEAGAQPRVDDRRSGDHHERHGTTDQVIARRLARLWLEKAVVDDVEPDDTERSPYQDGFRGQAGPRLAAAPVRIAS